MNPAWVEYLLCSKMSKLTTECLQGNTIGRLKLSVLDMSSHEINLLQVEDVMFSIEDY